MNPFAPIAVVGFWILIVVGLWLDEIGWKTVTVFVLLWIAGYLATTLVFSGVWFLPYVALLDAALALAVFKGDVILK